MEKETSQGDFSPEPSSTSTGKKRKPITDVWNHINDHETAHQKKLIKCKHCQGDVLVQKQVERAKSHQISDNITMEFYV